MKYSNLLGLFFAILLVVSCFLPWAFYPDLREYFTGFFSEQNIYGHPAKPLIFLAVVMSLFFIIPRVWAKRANIFIGILLIAFGLKSFILFSACYHGICPEKKYGIFLMVVSCFGMVCCALMPDGKVKDEQA